jgi:hypothetical protein
MNPVKISFLFGVVVGSVSTIFLIGLICLDRITDKAANIQKQRIWERLESVSMVKVKNKRSHGLGAELPVRLPKSSE